MASPLRGRRAEYAQATHDAIRCAAHELFVSKGYFATRVEEIARAARVSPATVYAVGGGKNGLLRDLIQAGTEDDQIAEISGAIESIAEPRELIRLIVDARRARFERWSGLIRQVVAAAPQEPKVRECLELANAAIHGGLTRVAHRLSDMGALRPGLTVEKATDILWYFVADASYFRLTEDLHWPLPAAADWLREQVTAALLDPDERR
ncbi:TetR/AcrR family transcriptional regulator [Dactylosporangium sp. CA-092794]|uniref:TetR/AcrR family transcriptional regulator n=1 Tax=Dactylosporangium sp. CA-092794 TaxID=3239929 RepID=UPI003D8E716B